MEEITHIGKIITIKNNSVTVSFEKQSACGSCDAKHYCALHKSRTQLVDITVENPAEYVVGQTVEMEINSSAGFKAVIYAYVIPLILMLTALFGIWAFKKDEFLAGLSAVIVLIPYYALLFAFKSKFSNKIDIRLR